MSFFHKQDGISKMNLKFVIAPDSFKESLTALQVATLIEAGFREVFPAAQYIKLPLADGGEGTVQALIDATGGMLRSARVIGPLREEIDASYGYVEERKLAVLEMAAASGLCLVPSARRDPRVTTTYGTGQLIRAALDAGARRFIIGIGGSATNDAGAGMLQALGASLTDSAGREIGLGGAELARLAHIDFSRLDNRLHRCSIDVASDVRNPLTGPNGASSIFGPQKGASPEAVSFLDKCLERFAEILLADAEKDVSEIPGAGAGGGIGAAFLALPNTQLRSGIDVIADAVELTDIVQDSDLVITGEGRTDGQTMFGKTPFGVAKIAAAAGVPVINIAGSASTNSLVLHEHGIDAIFSAVRQPCSLEEAFEEAEMNLQITARNVAAVLRIGMVQIVKRHPNVPPSFA